MKNLVRKDFLNQYGKDMEEKGFEYLNSIFGSVKVAVSLDMNISSVQYKEFPDGPWYFERLEIALVKDDLTVIMGINHKMVNSGEAGRYSSTELFLNNSNKYYFYENMGSLQKGLKELLGCVETN